MADERNRWLDRAAAERLLRGEPPVGPDADEQARADAARLRAALAALAPAPAGRELPGEAAALAAFRTFHAAPARLTDVDPHAAADAREPLIDLSPAPLVRTPAQRRRSAPLRFGLAAALASVAVGGLAAAASGLLDGSTHDSAAPGPAVSVSADADPTPSGDVTAPTPGPQPTPLRDREGAAPSPGASRLPGTEGRKDPGVPGSTPGPAGTGTAGTGTDGSGGRNDFTGGTSGATDGSSTDGGDRDKDKKDGELRLQGKDLCGDYRAGRLTGDRREKLIKLAKTVAQIPHYCADLLDGPGGTTKSGSAGPGASTPGGDKGGVLPAPTLLPGGALGFRTPA
ncbi:MULTISPECIES: hypothetical protein [unclassified Streptomyces]|uniref:hypothetical protein n=1 Tax=unclassified Streptomyces TaxID=2593676 RepID=UPI002E3285C5|nr:MULTISPECIES: hypothetical protein [unclassified Streptomyces]WUC64968.1 hypothetical protein OG861_12385 [Streptomyces sp. NBC_00539]